MQLLQRTASLPAGSGQWISCNRRPHCLSAVGRATPAMHCPTAWGQWVVELLQRIASLPRAVGSATLATLCRTAWGTVGTGTFATHRLTAWGQWAGGFLQHTASQLGGNGQCNSRNAVPYCLRDSGQWNSCNAPPHCLGAVGRGIPATHCLTSWG